MTSSAQTLETDRKAELQSLQSDKDSLETQLADSVESNAKLQASVETLQTQLVSLLLKTIMQKFTVFIVCVMVYSYNTDKYLP